MKKLTIKALALVMAIILILPFAFACTDDEDTPTTSSTKAPEKTFDQMDEKEKAFYILNLDYDKEENIRQEMNMSVDTVIEGYSVIALVNVVEIERGIGTDNYIHHMGSGMYMDMGVYQTAIVDASGYRDGKMYETLSEDNLSQYKYWSSISQADYLSYQESLEEDDDGDFGITKSNCRTATCVKDNNGNWVATFSGLSGSALEELQEMVDGLADPSTLIDGKIILTVDSNLRPVSASIEFIFEGTVTPEISCEMVYKYGDEATVPDINFNDFEEVDDLRELARE